MLVPDSLAASLKVEPRQLRGWSALGATLLLAMDITARLKSGISVGLPASMMVLSHRVAFCGIGPLLSAMKVETEHGEVCEERNSSKNGNDMARFLESLLTNKVSVARPPEDAQHPLGHHTRAIEWFNSIGRLMAE